MNNKLRKLMTALAAAAMLLGAGSASADRGGRWNDDDGWQPRHHHHRHWRHDHRWSGYAPRTVVRERVVVREVPVVREYGYYEPAPARAYYPDPSVVIGVNIPPLVIPLR